MRSESLNLRMSAATPPADSRPTALTSAEMQIAPASPGKPVIIAPEPVRPAPKRHWKWVVALLLVAAAGYAAYRYQSQGETDAATAAKLEQGLPAARTAAVTTGLLEHTIRLTGETAATDFANITAPLLRGDGGREMILMKVATSGSWVKKGQLIAEIDAQALVDRLDDLADTIKSAEADIGKRAAEQAIEWENLQQSIRVAKTDLDKARLDARASEVRTDIEQQLMKLNLEEAEARYKQLQKDLDQKKIAHQADLNIQKINLNRSVNRRDRLARDMKLYSITAPMEGLVVMSTIIRNNEMSQVQQGDRLFPGQSFMKIVNTREMLVRGSVNQSQIGDLRLGQEADVRFDAFRDLKLQGKVVSIGALAVGGPRQGNYIRSVPVSVLISGTDKRLIPDLSASADIKIARTENATMVPLAAVRYEDSGSFALVQKGETFDKTPVALGLRNNTHAAVTNGLRAGDVVRVN